jgi:phosphoglycerate dehydrogenase-like enzyme
MDSIGPTGDFARGEMMGMELRDRVLGVVGFGRIGRRVAEICGLGLKMRHVACTPHIASFTDRGQAAMRAGVVDQLLQLLAGERPPNIVNPAAWPGRMAGRV